MVLEPIPEEPEDEFVDLFNLSEREGAPPKRAVWRSLSAPSRFHFENNAADAERQAHLIIPESQKKHEETYRGNKVRRLRQAST
jgi:hypothetical protein